MVDFANNDQTTSSFAMAKEERYVTRAGGRTTNRHRKTWFSSDVVDESTPSRGEASTTRLPEGTTSPDPLTSTESEVSHGVRAFQQRIDETVRGTFKARIERWKRDTASVSSMSQIVMHPEYQKIIGMGRDVVPLLLEELRRSPRWLFWALKAITDEDPVAEEDRGNLSAMVDAWMQWGESNGIES